MRNPKVNYFLLLLGLIAVSAIPVIAQKDYPVPPKTKTLLFYFQRNHNRNTVVYELNTLPDGRINIKEPVIGYWIRYEEGGVRKELSFLQLRGYGIQSKLVDKEKESFILHFNSMSKREIYLLKAGKSEQYKTYIKINGELSELTNMYLQAENNSLGIPLSVKYVDISGINLKTGKNVTERFKP